MKRNLIFIAASLLIGLVSCGEKHTTDVEDMGMTGDVHKLREFKYNAVESFGEVTQGDAFREEGEWDREIIFSTADHQRWRRCRKHHVCLQQTGTESV